MNPYLAMLFIAGMLGGLMVGLRFLQKRFELNAEVSRKLMHVIMGLVTLNLPWLFTKNWPVVSLALLTALALFGLKHSKLKDDLGQVLHAVKRSSYGDLAFPLAVATVFVLSQGNAVLYCIPILILTLADATAALIGLRYGSVHYQAAEGSKSVEGSIAFLGVTFNSVLLSLLIFTDIGKTESILIAFILGLLVMMLEAVSWAGLDNLFIPLASFLLLSNLIVMTQAQLLANLSFILGLILLIIIAKQPIVFDSTGVMAAAVIGYLIWATGGWLWLLAPITFFLSYRLILPKAQLSSKTNETRAVPVTVYSVLSVTAAGLIWLLFADALMMPNLILPYMLSFAAYLALVGVARAEKRMALKTRSFLIWQSIMFAWFIIPFGFYIWRGFRWQNGLILLSAFVVISLAAFVFYYIQPEIKRNPSDMVRWRWQGGIAAASSLLGVIPLFFL